MSGVITTLGRGLALAAALWASSAHLAAESRSLISNSGFTSDKDYDGWPDGWPKGPGLSWHPETEPNLSYVRLQTVTPGKGVFFFRAMRLSGAATSVDYFVQARAHDIVAGSEAWHDARILFEFRDANNAKVGPAPAPLIVSHGGSQDWKTFKKQLAVPAGATQLVVLAALFNCESGSLDVGLVEVTENE